VKKTQNTAIIYHLDDGTSTQLWLVTEYIPNGSLFDYLVANEISMTIGLQFIRSIANGLTYLHTNVPGASESFCNEMFEMFYSIYLFKINPELPIAT
jgi:serine/threonine protein kinase